MKKYKYLLYIILTILLFSGCSPENNKIDNKLNNHDILSNKRKYENKSHQFIYNLKKEINTANDFLEINKISIPEEINMKKIHVEGFIDEKKLLLFLSKEDLIDNMNDYSLLTQEIGIYNFESQEYENLLEFEEYLSIYIVAYNKDYIVYQELDFSDTDDMDRVDKAFNTSTCDIELKVLNCKTKEVSLIHTYSDEYRNSSIAYQNKITIKDQQLYFDDIVIKNDEKEVELYKTDLKNVITSKIKDGRQNPIIYRNEVIVIGKSNGLEYNSLFSLNDEHILDLNSNISEIVPTEESIYTLNVNTDEEARISTNIIIDVIKDDELLFTDSSSIDRLNANRFFMSWSNYEVEKPILYFSKTDNFLVFDEISEAYNLFTSTIQADY